MKFQSFRSAVVIASVMVASVTASQAFAQTPIDVLTGNRVPSTVSSIATSTYKFTGSMILNSIGFYTNGTTPQSLSYSVKGTTYIYNTHFFDVILGAEENGFRWLTISPESMLNNDIVTVSTLGPSITIHDPPFDPRVEIGTEVYSNVNVNSGANVSYNGLEFFNGGTFKLPTYSNSNLRVSNPSSNVAPEPGSFALALTGGAALLGICIRRRRNAA
jgi:hypothetical protein